MALKKKKIKEIYTEGNNVIFIIENVHNSTSFSRSINPMIRKEFRKWISNPLNRKKIGWTYISRWRIVPNDDYMVGKNENDPNYYTYKGIVETF